MNVEGVDDRAVPFRSQRYQRFASLGLLDNVQDRIVGIRRFPVAKIHACREADIDAARGQPKIDVGRHRLAALTAHNAAGFDGPDGVKSGDEVGPGPSPAAEAMIQCLVLRVRWMVVTAGRDRKSTRLNSSHQIISYAVFFLKKKKNERE